MPPEILRNMKRKDKCVDVGGLHCPKSSVWYYGRSEQLITVSSLYKRASYTVDDRQSSCCLGPSLLKFCWGFRGVLGIYYDMITTSYVVLLQSRPFRHCRQYTLSGWLTATLVTDRFLRLKTMAQGPILRQLELIVFLGSSHALKVQSSSVAVVLSILPWMI